MVVSIDDKTVCGVYYVKFIIYNLLQVLLYIGHISSCVYTSLLVGQHFSTNFILPRKHSYTFMGKENMCSIAEDQRCY